jgi:uncharacterized protein
MASEPAFDVSVPSDAVIGDRLVIGTAQVGLAGLTAIDYVVTHGNVTQVGYVSTRNLPDITPFSAGEPRFPIRVYTVDDSLSILVSEVFLPVWVSDLLADSLFAWIENVGIEELAYLHGVPFPHGPGEHDVFLVGTEPFREANFGRVPYEPLGGGFLDGLVGELTTRGMESETSVGALVTPTHPPGPDLEAAIRLLEATTELYGIDVDPEDLRQRSEEMRRYYTELAEQMRSLQESDQSLESRDYPEDRMYM